MRSGQLDLLAPMVVGDLGTSCYRDVLGALPPDLTLPWVVLLGIGLVTSANPVFDHLTRTPGLVALVDGLDAELKRGSGFSDHDLDGAVCANLITARGAGELLLAVTREATGELSAVRDGLAIGARTTRLVRDAEDQAGLPGRFCAPNKTGSLFGVRNDTAVFTDGSATLAVAALTATQEDGVAVDGELADLGTALVAARWLR